MPVRVVHRLDKAAVRRLLASPQGGLARDLLRRGLRVQTAAKRNLAGVGGPKRINNGHLRNSIQIELVTISGYPAVRVGSNLFYALYVHEGTGIYGPRGAPIRPTSKQFLVFTPRGAPGPVFARQVKGMEPNRFLTNALPAARR